MNRRIKEAGGEVGGEFGFRGRGENNVSMITSG
jgi:hypothetical protein